MAKITYYDVARQCNQLLLIGEKPSVRKIRVVLGGSFTTINEHLAQWRKEQELTRDSEFPKFPKKLGTMCVALNSLLMA